MEPGNAAAVNCSVVISCLGIKSVYLLEEVLLYFYRIVACEALCSCFNVAVEPAILGEVLVCRAVDAVLVGICKSLHDEHSVCQLDLTVTVCIAPYPVAVQRLGRSGGLCGR